MCPTQGLCPGRGASPCVGQVRVCPDGAVTITDDARRTQQLAGVPARRQPPWTDCQRVQACLRSPKNRHTGCAGCRGRSHKECGHHPALQTSRSGWGRGVTNPRKRCLSTYRDHPLQCHTVRMPASRLGKLRFGDGRPLVRGPRVGQRQSQDSNPRLPHSQALTKV